MATNVTAQWSGRMPDGTTSDQSATISVNDQVVRRPNLVGGWTNSTVTADVAPSLVFSESDGVKAGRYQKVSTGVFRHELG